MRTIAVALFVLIGTASLQAGVGHALKQTGCVVTRLHKCHKKVATKAAPVKK